LVPPRRATRGNDFVIVPCALFLLSVMDTDLARGLVVTMVVGCLFKSFLLDHTESLFYAWLSGLLYRLAPSRGRQAIIRGSSVPP